MKKSKLVILSTAITLLTLGMAVSSAFAGNEAVTSCGRDWYAEHRNNLATIMDGFLGFYIWFSMITAGLGVCALINLKIINKKKIKSSDKEKNNLRLLMKAGVIGFLNFVFFIFWGGYAGLGDCVSVSRIYLLFVIITLAVIFFLFSLVMRLTAKGSKEIVKHANRWLIYGAAILVMLALDIITFWPIYSC